MIDQYKIKSVHYYNHKLNNKIDAKSDFDKFLKTFFSDLDAQIIERKMKRDLEKAQILKSVLRKISRIATYSMGAIKNYRGLEHIPLIFQRFNRNKKTILLYGLTYDLRFLKKALRRKYNIVYYKLNQNRPIGKRRIKINDQVDAPNIEINKSSDKTISFLIDDIEIDFKRNISSYIEILSYFDQLNEKYSLCCGIWDTPACHGSRPLFFEYLKSKNIPVIGAQHGSSYGERDQPWHYDSDYQHCSDFISYGFEKEDLMRAVPSIDLAIEVHPCGMNIKQRKNKNRKKIDIVFPLTNCTSMVTEGVKRIPPHELTMRQIKILEYLDSLENLKIVVKPFINATHQRHPIYPDS